MITTNTERKSSAYQNQIIEIKKGEKYSLTKLHPELRKFFISLAGTPCSINNRLADVNLSAFLLNTEGKVNKDEDFLAYIDGFRMHSNSAVAYSSDLKTMVATFQTLGRIFSKTPVIPLPESQLEDIDDEAIYIDLTQMGKARRHTLQRFVRRTRGGNAHFTPPPATFERIIFTLSVYDGERREQYLNQADNVFLRLMDITTKRELFRIKIPPLPDTSTAAIVLSLYKEGQEWMLESLAEGFDEGLQAACFKHGLEVIKEERFLEETELY